MFQIVLWSPLARLFTSTTSGRKQQYQPYNRSGNGHAQQHISTSDAVACVDGCLRYDLNLSYSGNKTATVTVSAAKRDHKPNQQREATPPPTPTFTAFLQKLLIFPLFFGESAKIS